MCFDMLYLNTQSGSLTLGIIQFSATAGIIVDDVVYFLKGLLKHGLGS